MWRYTVGNISQQQGARRLYSAVRLSAPQWFNCFFSILFQLRLYIRYYYFFRIQKWMNVMFAFCGFIERNVFFFIYFATDCECWLHSSKSHFWTLSESVIDLMKFRDFKKTQQRLCLTWSPEDVIASHKYRYITLEYPNEGVVSVTNGTLPKLW